MTEFRQFSVLIVEWQLDDFIKKSNSNDVAVGLTSKPEVAIHECF